MQIGNQSRNKKHQNFIYATVESSKWLFWKRKFAFQVVDGSVWFGMPSLTPWSYNHGITQFGLNSTFAKKHAGRQLKFITWI